MNVCSLSPYCVQLYDDISEGQENVKISFANDLDSERLPSSFEYTPFNIAGTGACQEDFETVPEPCCCISKCSHESCSCLLSYGLCYQESILKEELSLPYAKPVIECSGLCTCDSTCDNRVVQHGVKYLLQVFKTVKKGFAVRALSPIPKLGFVCEYAGEVISSKEAEKRHLNKQSYEPNYIFLLKEYNSENKMVETIVDPTNIGNVGRYLNHSCSPNLIMVPVRAENMVPKLCLFAVRDIFPLEELCYNYGSTGDLSITDKPINLQSKACSSKIQLKQCYCESVACTGYLPFVPNLFSSDN